jgi:hypothetical protein
MDNNCRLVRETYAQIMLTNPLIPTSQVARINNLQVAGLKIYYFTDPVSNFLKIYHDSHFSYK